MTIFIRMNTSVRNSSSVSSIVIRYITVGTKLIKSEALDETETHYALLPLSLKRGCWDN